MAAFYADLWRLAALITVFAAILGVIKWMIHRKRTSCSWKKAGLTVSEEPATGIVFGRDKRGKYICSLASDEGHCAVFGSSGCGKTSGLLIPTLRAWTSDAAQNNTCFAIDISGDVSGNVRCKNKLIFEPGNSMAAPYNVFAMIDSLSSDSLKNEALAQLAYLLLPEEADSSPASRFWRSGARNLLTASLIYLYHMGLDFPAVCDAITTINCNTLLDRIAGSDSYAAMRYIARCPNLKPDVLASFKATCDEAVMLFCGNEKVAKSLRRPHEGEVAFTPACLETHNVFVVIPDDKLTLYAPLMQIIAGQCLEYFSSRPSQQKGKILFALDEFASLRLDITDALRKLRKKGIRILICTQSLADINATLGHDAHKTLLTNFKYKVLMAVDEADSQAYFARLIGREEKSERSQTSRHSRVVSETWSSHKDYALEPTELARLGDDLILLHPMGWSRLRKNYYFKKR